MDRFQTEPDIVRGLQNGDPDAWAAVCHRHSERLWTYVSRLIGSNEAVVADVFQETLLAVAKSGRTLSDHSRLWPWLAAIGHNQCALYWRKQNRRSTEQLGEGLLQTADLPEHVLEQHETVMAVRVLLADMSAAGAAVLTAKYIDGLSAVEIAELHGETVTAVRSRLARARREFRERFKSMSDETVAVDREQMT